MLSFSIYPYPQPSCVFRINNDNSNWDWMMSFEGDMGPYLQYAHAQLTSLMRKNPELLPLLPPEQIAAETLVEPPVACEIAFWGACTQMLCGRCARMSRAGWSRSRSGSRMRRAWETVVVKGKADVERARAQMWLYLCARDILRVAMWLLSICPLECM